MEDTTVTKKADGRVIIISAPSGTGKSTIISYLMTLGLNLHFSVSATSRPPRGKEVDGVDYFFSHQKISANEFQRATSWNMRKSMKTAITERSALRSTNSWQKAIMWSATLTSSARKT